MRQPRCAQLLPVFGRRAPQMLPSTVHYRGHRRPREIRNMKRIDYRCWLSLSNGWLQVGTSAMLLARADEVIE